jgi:hypothetical protein
MEFQDSILVSGEHRADLKKIASKAGIAPAPIAECNKLQTAAICRRCNVTKN